MMRATRGWGCVSKTSWRPSVAAPHYFYYYYYNYYYYFFYYYYYYYYYYYCYYYYYPSIDDEEERGVSPIRKAIRRPGSRRKRLTRHGPSAWVWIGYG